MGCIAAVSSSLHVGKAGPLVHTGACIASILGQGGSRKYHMTCKWLRYFKNDRDGGTLLLVVLLLVLPLLSGHRLVESFLPWKQYHHGKFFEMHFMMSFCTPLIY